jgi:hypothetical protein
MGRIWLVPLLVLFWACGARAADACTCASRSAGCGPPGEYWRASAVFTGRVIAVERASPRSRGHRIRVRPIQKFRGAFDASDGEIAIVTPDVCRYPFKAGRVYFIYATQSFDGHLTTTSCSRTRPIEDAGDELIYARLAMSGSAPPGRIVGEVRHASADDPARAPVPGVRVALAPIGSITAITTNTDAHGRYAFEVAAGGSYRLDVSAPASMYLLLPLRAIDLADSHACVESNVDLFFDGHISGRIVDAADKGVGGLTVGHVRLEGAARSQPSSRRTLTKDDGTFRIEKVPPGPFVVTVELPVDDTLGDTPSGGAVPGVRGVLGRGERRALELLRLPDRVRIARLVGTVLGADGSPAAGARVFLKTDTDSGHIVGEPAVTDSLGRFVIAVVEDEGYRVFAERQTVDGRTARSEFSDPIAVVATHEAPPLRLTVRRRF